MARGDEERDEGFLGRWARRKREAQQPERRREGEAKTPPPRGEGQGWGAKGSAPASPEWQGGRGKPPIDEPGPTPPIPNPSPPEGGAAGSGAQAEPDRVEPPSLDLVDKDFDLAPWLKQNVPESWKLAALRRAWESDPAIAGYLDPARDYALDWNTPGGAPGYGPLSASDNVEEMLANIFGKAPEPAAEATEPAETLRNDDAVLRPSSNAAGGESADAPRQELPPLAGTAAAVRLSEDGDPPKNPQKPAESAVSAESSFAAPHNSPAASPVARPSRRRGGGAIPV